jgi:hypothetical protein
MSIPGLPDGIFSNQKYQFGKFWRVLQWKMLLNFMAIWYILLPFGIVCDLFGIFYEYFIFSRFGMLYQEKSGNPGAYL